MGIIRTGTGGYEREMARWEQLERDVIAVDDLGNALAPGNKYQKREFPKMIYRAHKKTNGTIACLDNPLAYRTEIEQIDAEAFSRRCQLIVQDEAAFKRAIADGWAESPKEALEKYEQQQIAIGDETAARHYRDQSMSQRSQDEALAIDRSVSQHLPDVPTVRKKRGRPKSVNVQGAPTTEQSVSEPAAQ